MRLHLLLVPLLAVGFAGCDQQQTKLLELERQMQAKDKTIADLAHSNNDLQQQLAKLQAGDNSDKMAETISDAVAKRIETQQTTKFDDLKKQLDEIAKLQKTGAPVASDAGPVRGNVPPGAPVPRTTAPSDPSRTRYNFNF